MALESFYGGKQGLSSIIKKSFKYICKEDPAFQALSADQQAEALKEDWVMEECLCRQDYNEVWYGELCLIDTVNKNNPANGYLYRRTLAKQGADMPVFIKNDAAETVGSSENKLSAEYIGQIVGPQSGTPNVRVVSTWTNNDIYAETEPTDLIHTAYLLGEGGNIIESGGIPIGYDSQNMGDVVYDSPPSTLDSNRKPHVYQSDAIADGVFVSGKYQDNIYYNWVNVRNNADSPDAQTWMYLGLSIPYLAQDWAFETLDYNKEVTPVNAAEDKKFYQDWTISIPRGVRGNAAGNIRITNLTETEKKKGNVYLDFSCIKQENNIFKINTDAPKLTESEIAKRVLESKFFDKTPRTAIEGQEPKEIPFYVYDYTIYNQNDGDFKGQTVSIFLGITREIESFKLEDDGTIIAKYSDLTQNTINGRMHWIKNVTVNGPFDKDNPGLLTINYNYGDPYTKNLGLVNGATYNNTTNNADAGKITFQTTDGSEFELKNFQHKQVKDVKLAGDTTSTDDQESRKIRYNTNISDTYVEIGDNINYIQEMVIDPIDHHLYVLFNDPKHRYVPVGSNSPAVYEDPNTGIRWRNDIKSIIQNRVIGEWEYNNEGQLVESTKPNKVYWRDYGRTLAEHTGDKIAEIWDITNGAIVYNGEPVTNTQEILDALNGSEEYQQGLSEIVLPDGQGTIDAAGMLIAAVMENNGILRTEYFAFDYDQMQWQLIKVDTDARQNNVIYEGWDEDGYYDLPLSQEGITLTHRTVESLGMRFGDVYQSPWTWQGMSKVTDYSDYYNMDEGIVL